jgi:uncharacterized protein (TIGR03382 family)
MRTTATLLVALAALLSTGAAHAYCRTSVCATGMPHTAAVCSPPYMDDCGIPLFRSAPCVEYSLQEDGSPKLGLTAADMEPVMQAAFGTWMSAACPSGGTPHILVTQGPGAVCHVHEYNSKAGNANVIMFHDDSWPYEGSPNTLALTTVTYDLNTGEIYDADMELNSADNHFTLGDTSVDFDLLSIVTHESGHFLGLAHSHEPSAVMWPDYVEHTTNLRHLTPDDVAGICAVYPPAGEVTNCDPTPRHGFSPLCSADQTTSGNPTPINLPCVGGPCLARSTCCTIAPGSTPESGRGATVVAALGALALAIRSRRRRA